MLETLITVVQTGEFEDTGGLRLHSMRSAVEGMVLELFLDPGDGGAEQPWEIECSGVRDYLVRGECVDRLSVVSEHPVLLPFAEPVTDLYFYSASPNPTATIGALFEQHLKLVDNWIPFDRFLNNRPKELSHLLACPSGQLASGPVSLMQAYSRVLTEQGVRSSMLPSQPPKFWDGQKWVAPDKPLHALLLGSSYVVAEKFHEQKLGV